MQMNIIFIWFGYSIKDAAGFSSNSDELIASYHLFNTTVISPMQEILIEGIREVLEVNGIAIIVWRNDDSFIHRLVHGMAKILSLSSPHLEFPQINHSMGDIESAASNSGFKIIKQESFNHFQLYESVRSCSF